MGLVSARSTVISYGQQLLRAASNHVRVLAEFEDTALNDVLPEP